MVTAEGGGRGGGCWGERSGRRWKRQTEPKPVGTRRPGQGAGFYSKGKRVIDRWDDMTQHALYGITQGAAALARRRMGGLGRVASFHGSTGASECELIWKYAL